ncbi:MAG: hypothetical protein KDH96_12865, partial [Candidatus Riesia sp.]|nr:hypothetical protein [Candidatus Riesia sp.]
ILDINTNTEQTLNIILANKTKLSTSWNNHSLEVKDFTWYDLSNNGSGLDNITTRDNMTINKTDTYMWFEGTNPNKSWVKFEDLVFSLPKEISFIFKVSGSFYIGISNITTNTTSNYQPGEGLFLAHFSNNKTFKAIKTQNNYCVNSTNFEKEDILKLKISYPNYVLYKLPSSDKSNWDNEDTIIVQGSCSCTITIPTQVVPFIIPRNDSDNSFYAIQVKDI